MRLGVLALLLAGPAFAAPQILPPGTKAAASIEPYSRTPAYAKLIAQAVARVPAAVALRCAGRVVDDGAIIIADPLEFARDGAPTGGSWRHSVPLRGCGAEVLVSFFFFVDANRRVLTVLGVPGSSHADLAQQRNARTFATLALFDVAGRCRHFEPVDTRFDGYGHTTPQLNDPGEKAEFRPWRETWTMLGCGTRYAVPLNFSPNRLGTAITQPGGIGPR